MTSEERVDALHARMKELKHAREQRKTAAIGALSFVLAVCLGFAVFGGAVHSGGAAGEYSGATILFENAGGYVLAAVLAFMAGAGIAALIIRKRIRKSQEEQKETEEDSSKEGNDEDESMA